MQTEHLQFDEVPNLKWNVLDSLKCHGQSLSQILDKNLPCIIYVSDNECAECIYKFINFNESILDIPEAYQCVYILFGEDDTVLDYYMKEKEVRLNSRSYMIKDSTFIFHHCMKDYLGNHIFILNKGNTFHIQTNPLKDRNTFDDFRALLKRR